MIGYHYSIEYLCRDIVVVTDRDINIAQHDEDNISVDVISVVYAGREIRNLVNLSSVLSSIVWCLR